MNELFFENQGCYNPNNQQIITNDFKNDKIKIFDIYGNYLIDFDWKTRKNTFSTSSAQVCCQKFSNDILIPNNINNKEYSLS